MSLLLGFALAVAPAVVEPKAKPGSEFDKPVPAGKVSVANPRSIAAALQEAGYRAKVVFDDGNPYVDSAANGANFSISLENCKEHKNCQDAMFRSTYAKKDEEPVTLETINKFNADHRWVRAYLGKDGGPVLEQDLLFTEQLMDKKMFEEAVTIWEDLMDDFHKAIDF
jgi:hypothetical protein